MTSTDPPPRHTRQRAAVSAIMTTLDEFRTAQDVHAELRQRGEAIGLATVYRTLARMAADGEVDSIRTPEGVAAYRRCSAGHHHHLVCRECGRTVEITPPDLEAWTEQVGREFGFTHLDHELELFGRCPDCG
ncbi:MAG: transcriptional repressor [Propionibacteriaceae bacterium]|jgi:Fur family ferric uptake transcriptional regulator|nr:transcriptional repressor [Propionibacteriaceae bacterium]